MCEIHLGLTAWLVKRLLTSCHTRVARRLWDWRPTFCRGFEAQMAIGLRVAHSAVLWELMPWQREERAP